MDKMLKQGYRGSRYSFGYPACPNLADQKQLLDLLGAERIGVAMSDEDQLAPRAVDLGHRLPPPAGEVFQRVSARPAKRGGAAVTLL